MLPPVVEVRVGQPLVVLFGLVLAGVSCDRYLAVPLVAWPIVALGGWLGWLAVRWKTPDRDGSALILLAAFATAGLGHHLHWRRFAEDDVGRSAQSRPSPVCVRGIVVSAVRLYTGPSRHPMDTLRNATAWRFEFRVAQVRDGAVWRTASGKTVVRVAGDALDLRVGDRIHLMAILSRTAPPANPGEWDFREYERSDRRLCRLDVDTPHWIHIEHRGGRANLATLLGYVRDHCHRNLARYTHPTRSGLASAALLGMREHIDQQRTEDYLVTGTIHLLSISGLHVGILAGGLWWIARFGWLSRKTTLVAATLFVVIYAVLTESRPPVVRAAVLISVMCAARFWGRQAFSGNTLSAAGLVVLVLNPSSFFHVGTQLSFLAVASIGIIPGPARRTLDDDPLGRLIAETRSWPIRVSRRVMNSVWRAIWTTTVVWGVAVPLVAYRFHLVTPIATILNPIVCLPMAVSLFSGFGAMALGRILPPIAAVLGWICDRSLASMEWCLARGAALPGGYWWTPAPPRWWVLAFYSVAAVWLICPRVRPAQRWMYAAALFWLAIGGWLTMGPAARCQPPGKASLTVHFISVGHGTSVLLEFPSGKTALYDAGRLGIADQAARSIAGVLWSRGITHLDALLISHADADHYNAIPELLTRFSVGTVLTPPGMFRRESPSVTALHAGIKATGVPIEELSRGHRLQTGDGVLGTILHPPSAGCAGSDNANSLVMLLEWQGRTVLLPGDLESPGLEMLLAQPALPCDLIMAPHHGSMRSDPAGFAVWSTPQYVVISGSLGRDYGAVRRAYEASGAIVLHTAESGCVTVVCEAGTCQVSTFRVGMPGPRP